MTNDVKTLEPNTNPPATIAVEDDGFDNVDLTDRLIQGTLRKCNVLDAVPWQKPDGTPDHDRYIVVKTRTVVQRWVNKAPVETLDEPPAHDLEGLNSAIPQEQWETGLNGEPRPPWQRQKILYLLNPETAEMATYVAGTIGGHLAVEELKRAVQRKRWLSRDRRCFPIITLGTVPMKTRFGQRPRPFLKIEGWVGPEPTATPATVEDKRPKADLDDEIPF